MNIPPDVNDPNCYCKSCQTKYKSRQTYRFHLKNTDNIVITRPRRQPLFDPTMSVDDTKHLNNASCAICKFTYISRYQYRLHMKRIHQVGRNNTPVHRIISIANPSIQPDPNDPNFYCKSCQTHYSSRQKYRQHIKLSHTDVKLDRCGARHHITVEMDAEDRDNTRCKICNKDYSTRWNYRKHMNMVHRDGKREPVRKGALRRKIDTSIAPIWDDPSNHCRSCKKTYSTKSTYRVHFRKFHSGILQGAKQLPASNTTQQMQLRN